MKVKVNLTMKKESLEKLNDLAKMFGVSRSVILERILDYIYDNDLEGEIWNIKKKKRKGEKDIKEVEDEYKPSSSTDTEEFTLKL